MQHLLDDPHTREAIMIYNRPSMQQDYNKALQNQKVRVDANVNYSGGVNVNHSGGINLNNSGSVDYNHYFRF